MGKLSGRFASGAGKEIVRWLLGLILLGAAGVFIADRLFSTTNEEMEALRVRADSAIQASEAKDTVVARLREQRNVLRDSAAVDSTRLVALRVQRDRLGNTARTLRLDLSKAKTKIDTIRLYVKTIQIQDSVIEVCGLEVETCMERGAKLDSIVRLQDTAISVLTVDRDSLRTIVADFLSITHSCKNGQADLLLFKFCKPDPVVTFLAGAVVGGSLACWATHCLSDDQPVVYYPPEEY